MPNCAQLITETFVAFDLFVTNFGNACNVGMGKHKAESGYNTWCASVMLHNLREHVVSAGTW